MNDYAFDAAGNTTRDALLRKFTYDAENKQTKVETVNRSGAVTGTIGEYFYDGDGRRVKKVAYTNNQVTETTVFVYDASSRLVAEYSTNLNPTPQVAYLTNDHLGSPRINTNENGAVISRHDYRPYGEEITERTHSQYAPDTIRKQFTGYERDGETDLDFAQARYFQKLTARFYSADPILMSFARLVDPQRINRYQIGRNNPLKWIEPSGRDIYLANQAARDLIWQLFGGLTVDERNMIEIDSGGRVLLRDDCRRNCEIYSVSPAFEILRDAIFNPRVTRVYVLSPGEMVTLQQPATDFATGAQIAGYSYDDLIRTGGVAVPNPDGSWDVYLPSSASEVEGLNGQQIPTTLATMGPHEIAHTQGVDAVALENRVRESLGMPRRSGGDHCDQFACPNPSLRRQVNTPIDGDIVQVPAMTVEITITPRPMIPIPKTGPAPHSTPLPQTVP